MKRLKLCMVVIAAIIISSTCLRGSQAGVEITKGWQFRQARLENWYPATVPGVVQTDLIDNKIIEDPYYRLNERGIQWVDKEDWIYQTSFDVPAKIFSQNNIRLEFLGLDTYADVYLNEEKILAADNMFRTWMVDVKGKVKQSGNVLKIYFHSPLKIDMPKWEALPYKYDSGNDQSENGGMFDRKVGIFARKAGYHYGWDWGPRIVTSGIWRPVKLSGWSDMRITDVQYIQEQVSVAQAKVRTIVEVESDKDVEGALVSVSTADKTLGSARANLKKGINSVEVAFVMKKPRLWWSLGLGEAYLYDMKSDVKIAGNSADMRIDKIGIRSIKLVREKDSIGRSFYFELNGQPVFAKGANYIPCDIFLPRVTREKYEQTIMAAVDVNMNMLRVWGGGVYEDDYFYELCDKHGILVWQDFMFACALYPAEGALLENIRQEAIDNVRRLRNHASIAIWCGNNECQDAWYGWGLKKRYEKQNPEWAAIIWKQFEDTYYKVLPQVVEEHGSGIAYIPSSPFADYGKGSNDHEGDRHFWDIWHGKRPLSDYNKERSRFFSEYGFQSFPEFESVKIYAPELRDWSITSEVMMSHQRGGAHANNLIKTYMLNEYFEPKDFRSLLYLGSVLQGDAIKTAIEAHRRDMGYCWGTLYWQHNDCWPVASWSSRDWYGRWKAQHYFARYAFAPILVSPIEKEGKVDFCVVSDFREDVQGTLVVNVISMDGVKVNSVEHKVKLKGNTSTVVVSVPVETLIKGRQRGDVVINATLQTKQASYSSNYFLGKQKEINFPKAKIARKVNAVDGGYEVELSCDKFARAVFLSLDGIDYFFQDNFFDLLPGQPRKVKVTSKLTADQFDKQLKIVSLSDAY